MSNKKMLIKGAGKLMVKIPGCGNDLFTFATMNNMKLDIQLDTVDVEGGDSTFAIDTILRKKTIDIMAEDAKFDLNILKLVLGSKVSTGQSSFSQVDADFKGEISVDSTTTANKSIITLANVPNSGSVKIWHIKTEGGVTTKTELALDNSNTSVPANKFKAVSSDAGNKAFEIFYREGTVGNYTHPTTVYVEYTYKLSVPSNRYSESAYLWVLEEKRKVGNDNSVVLEDNDSNYFTADNGGKATIQFRNADKNSKLTRKGEKNQYTHSQLDKSNSSILQEDEFAIVDNKFYFHPSLKDSDVYANYKKKKDDVSLLDINVKDKLLTVHIVHDGYFEQVDGTLQGIQVEFPRCRIKSNFSLDMVRQQASTQSITLTVVDPDDASGSVGTIKRYALTSTNLDNC